MTRSAEGPLAITPLWWEGIFLRFGVQGVPVLVSGMRGHRRKRTAAALRGNPSAPVVIAGVAGGLTSAVSPGDLVVPDQVWSGSAVWRCPSAPLLQRALQGLGMTVHCGPIVEVDHIAKLSEKAHCFREETSAVDMESARILRLLDSRPAVVVRVIVDTPRHPLRSLSTPIRGTAALVALRRTRPVLHRWAQAARNTGPRTVFTDRVRRPGAVTNAARAGDLIFLVVSKSSMEDLRIIESLQQEGARVYRVHSVTEIDVVWIRHAHTIGVLRDDPVPRTVVDGIVDAVSGLGETEVVERADRMGTAGIDLSQEVGQR